MNIEGGITVGASTNTNLAVNAAITAGSGNLISAGATGAAIGGGLQNKVESAYAVIGAGRTNQILGKNSEGSSIGGGENNKVTGKFSSIAGGRNNIIAGNNSNIIGGSNNKISANNSVAAGQYNEVKHNNTFSWSDYSDSEEYYGSKKTFPSQKANTFLIRSLNGMGINTASSPDGLNVNINGALALGTEDNKVASTCNAGLAGTMEYAGNCLYACDGQHWQAFNLGFSGDNLSGACLSTVNAAKMCDF